jgi:sulfur transfer protein SufE
MTEIQTNRKLALKAKLKNRLEKYRIQKKDLDDNLKSLSFHKSWQNRYKKSLILGEKIQELEEKLNQQ